MKFQKIILGCMLTVFAAAGAAFGQQFSLDDNPAAPLTGPAVPPPYKVLKTLMEWDCPQP